MSRPEVAVFPRRTHRLGGQNGPDSNGPRGNNRQVIRASLKYSALGLEMGVAIGLGVLIGNWLDGKFQCRPVLTLVMLFLGIATAFNGLFRVVRQMQREATADNDADHSTESEKKERDQ